MAWKQLYSINVWPDIIPNIFQQTCKYKCIPSSLLDSMVGIWGSSRYSCSRWQRKDSSEWHRNRNRCWLQKIGHNSVLCWQSKQEAIVCHFQPTAKTSSQAPSHRHRPVLLSRRYFLLHLKLPRLGSSKVGYNISSWLDLHLHIFVRRGCIANAKLPEPDNHNMLWSSLEYCSSTRSLPPFRHRFLRLKLPASLTESEATFMTFLARKLSVSHDESLRIKFELRFSCASHKLTKEAPIRMPKIIQ